MATLGITPDTDMNTDIWSTKQMQIALLCYTPGSVRKRME